MADIDEKILDLITKQSAVIEKQSQVLDDLVTKTPATAQNANPLHGVGGLWSTPGLERDVITAHVRPFGIDRVLPMYPSSSQDPRFGSLTGFTATIGNQPTTVCADAPYGYVKGCNLTARFGLDRLDTNTIDIAHVNMKINRGDFTDLFLRGQLLGMTNVAPKNLTPSQILNVITMSEMVTVGVNFERMLTREMWQGAVGLGQFPGLDSQIATGQIDADTSVTCPALDSDVKDFAFDNIGGTGRDIVEYLSMLEYYLKYNARTMGLEPVKWVLACRPELWFELSRIWPCKYLSDHCTFPNTAANQGGAFIINDNVNVDLRDRMRDTMQIPINGTWYDVVEDTGIYEYTNITSANCKAGEYASAIYFVPLTITGGFPVTYREYLDYSQSGQDEGLLKGTQTFWTDGGAYYWAVEYHNWCYKLAARTEQRVILRTPQLAGKIQRVKYSPLQHLREDYTDSAYFKDGGVSIRNHTWGTAVWK